MSQINPFTGSILQAPQVQRNQAAEKDRQVRKAHDLSKNAALQGDQHQHEVESAEAPSAVHEEQPKNPRRRKNAAHAHEESAQRDDSAGDEHLDLTA